MKQLLQNLKNGATEIAEVPAPGVGRGQVLIASRRTLVSAGTERMLVDFGKAGWIEKARQQPEKVRQVLDKIRTDGLIPTAEAVFRKLDEPMPLGYCNVGVVVDGPLRCLDPSTSSGPAQLGTGLAQGVPRQARDDTKDVMVSPSMNSGQALSNVMVSLSNHDILVGDRVASNGPHAEMVSVPRNLCAKIPDGVSDDEAAFTVLGAIALQGVRLALPTFGERFMVFGLGLVGLLTVQLLRASGCAVLGVDVNAARLKLAKGFGAETVDLNRGTDPVAAAMAWTGGRGVDGALIAASAKGDEIVHQAAQACRKRGRIVLVGVVDLNLQRADFYDKELTFQVSCSYGPGRYDEKYEQAGQDYPIGFVRWTEQRNFEAVLEAMRSGQLRVKELITHRLTLEEAAGRYEEELHDPAVLGILIEYPALRSLDKLGTGSTPRQARGDREDVMVSPSMNSGQALSNHDDTVNVKTGTAPHFPSEKRAQSLAFPLATPVDVGVIGAGNYARSILLPELSRTGARLAAVADLNPTAAAYAARKFGAGKALTDYREILADPAVQAVFVLVGHHLHSRFVCEALKAGKHVFVEKPLAITEGQLEEVVQATLRSPDPPTLRHPQGDKLRAQNDKAEAQGGVSYTGGNLKCHGEPFDELRTGLVEPSPFLMVGFNRRFSPHTVKIRELLAGRTEPLTMTMTVNAGYIPPEHWTQDPERGGGRIIGEGCHFIDLLSYLAGAPVTAVSAAMVGGNGPVRDDKISILLSFADGSVGAVHYFANGSKRYPKETLEIFGDGRVLRMENFRVTTGYGFKGFGTFRTWRQDKGHRAEIAAFVEAVAAGGPPLIPFVEIVNATRASFAAVAAARNGTIVKLA